ncbi:hypothetical protein V8J82_17170 [Gymnodinialimonas sp. 2305UL16-5]|uniref:hypothetical protein n=1 Tax=Gymnodinialimonas mytili TaxID=3126503 RepID=UPI0030B49DD6
MHPTPVTTEETVIGRVLTKFMAGDLSLFELIATDIDFRIDHFGDDVDTRWQQADTRDALMSVVGRLGEEVFPKGTEALSIDSFALGGGWHLTRFHQRFFYGVRQKDVTSLTYIVSHEANGVLDYFRENVTDIMDVQ